MGSEVYVDDERHGSIGFRRILDGLHDYAERMMRAEIAALPDGTWSFTDYLDGLGEHPEPLPLKVAVTVAGDEIPVGDFRFVLDLGEGNRPESDPNIDPLARTYRLGDVDKRDDNR